jgi:FkbM family methyltransferase
MQTNLKTLIRALKYCDGLTGLAYVRASLGRRRRVVRVRVRGCDLRVRTGTPDLGVAVSVFIKGEYESLQAENVERIVDAGANMGASTAYFARRFPDARIVAIEMEPENAALLRENVRGFANVSVVEAALDAEIGQTEIVDRGSSVGFTMAEAGAEGRATGQTVRRVTLDEVMREHGLERIDLLKVDVEGAEARIFARPGTWADVTGMLAVELHERFRPGCREAFDALVSKWSRVEHLGKEKFLAVR